MTDAIDEDLRSTPPQVKPVVIGSHQLKGFLGVPGEAKGLVIFAHGSGSGRFSPRNNQVAAALQQAGFATLVLDLLTPQEEVYRPNVFDIPLLANRLTEATTWAGTVPEIANLPIGYFGASTGAGAALVAAAHFDGRIRAVVSRGGRPDLAGPALVAVRAPTLLLVGSLDTAVIELNRQAGAQLRCRNELTIIPGASHLFEEPGTLEAVTREAVRWFQENLSGARRAPPPSPPWFSDRKAAGRALAVRLDPFRNADPLVLALPRGGVPVAAEIAHALGADLDLLMVRKLGAPGHPELGIGAVVDGTNPRYILNDEIVRQLQPSQAYIEAEAARQLGELERRRRTYLGGRHPIDPAHRTVIVVDDGIATGGTMRSALRALRQAAPSRLILAVPVAPASTLSSLAAECDAIVCLEIPEPFTAVGAYYEDFNQTTDEEVIHLLRAAAHARHGATS